MSQSVGEPPRLRQETLVLERHLDAPVTQVFEAYADVKRRARCSVPSDAAAVVYSEHDFRPSGTDRFKCGSKPDLQFSGLVRYVEIVKPWRIVYTEVISSEQHQLACPLVSWELSSVDAGSLLRVTDHVVSFVGDEMIRGSRMGMNAALDKLCGSFRR